MPFDAAAFERADLKPRTRIVEVPGLAAFFEPGEPARWTVRGLTASELQRAAEAKARQSSLESLADAFSGQGDKAEALRKLFHISADVPGEIVKRIEMLEMGSVEPKITQSLCVKLAESYPVEFLQLTSAITELTGQGADYAKPNAASQSTQPSTQA